eukprot:457837-Prymnesium_polylepis.1
MESSPLLSKETDQPVTPAPAAARVKESWGTRKRLEVTLKHVDQAGVDEMIDRAMRMGNAPKFIAQYHPQAQWLWRQWNGTVLQATWSPAVFMMLFSMALVLYMEMTRRTGSHRWSILEVPDPKDLWVARLVGVTTMWGYLLTMATFVNSFFLSQACAPAPQPGATRRGAGACTQPRLRPSLSPLSKRARGGRVADGFWLATKGNVRKVQGRVNDLGMLLAVHAARDASGKFTPESRELLEDVARWIRLYHIVRLLAWRCPHVSNRRGGARPVAPTCPSCCAHAPALLRPRDAPATPPQRPRNAPATPPQRPLVHGA